MQITTQFKFQVSTRMCYLGKFWLSRQFDNFLSQSNVSPGRPQKLARFSWTKQSFCNLRNISKCVKGVVDGRVFLDIQRKARASIFLWQKTRKSAQKVQKTRFCKVSSLDYHNFDPKWDFDRILGNDWICNFKENSFNGLDWE